MLNGCIFLFVQEKVTESSSKSSQLHVSRPGGHPYPAPSVPLDDEDGISYKGSFYFMPLHAGVY